MFPVLEHRIGGYGMLPRDVQGHFKNSHGLQQPYSDFHGHFELHRKNLKGNWE